MNIIDRVAEILAMDGYEFDHYLTYNEDSRRKEKLITATILLISSLICCGLIGYIVEPIQHTSAPFVLVSIIYLGWCKEMQDNVINTKNLL